MAIVINFPDLGVRKRQQLEETIKQALGQFHPPETEEVMLKAVMEVLDREELTAPVSFTLEVPAGEPFTDKQVMAVKEAMSQLNEHHAVLARNLVMEIILMRLMGFIEVGSTFPKEKR